MQTSRQRVSMLLIRFHCKVRGIEVRRRSTYQWSWSGVLCQCTRLMIPRWKSVRSGPRSRETASTSESPFKVDKLYRTTIRATKDTRTGTDSGTSGYNPVHCTWSRNLNHSRQQGTVPGRPLGAVRGHFRVHLVRTVV